MMERTGRIFEEFLERVKKEIGEKEFELAKEKTQELGKGILTVLHQLGLYPYQKQKELFIRIARDFGIPAEDGEKIKNPKIRIVRPNYFVLEDGSTYSYVPVPPSEDGKAYVVELPTFLSLQKKLKEKEEIEGEAENLFLKILKEAIDMDVSDIHIRPKGDVYYVYFRWKQDFIQRKDFTLPVEKGRSMLSWIKNYAHRYSKGMFSPDITTRVQDAKAEFRDLGVSLRLSFLPSPNLKDETLTIRILKIRERVIPLEELGYLEGDLKVLKDVMKRRGGVVLFSGKTNSGKTTTIASLLSSVKDRNVLTVEDPIEYIIPNSNVVQHQVFETLTEDIKATFLDYARGFKRSDPDIVFVGEWRNDPELSKVIEELSLAGQLVLTTIHLPSAFVIYDAIPSMYGVSREVLIRSVLFSINQVLVDLPCKECSVEMNPKEALKRLIDKGIIMEDSLKYLPYANTKEMLERILSLERIKVKGEGCDACRGTGKAGLTPIYEYLYPTEEFKEWVKKENPSPYLIEKRALEEGIGKNKLQVFYEKLKRGMVAMDEIGKLR